MTKLAVSAALVVAAAAAVATTADAASFKVSEDVAFQMFMKAHGKQYATAAEHSQRKQNFIANMKKAEELKAANPLATFGVNAFSDLSEEEFKAYHNGAAHFKAVVEKQQPVENIYTSITAGASIDWRKKGAVTSVKNQGQCGSCWAFSAVGNIEGEWAIAGNKLVSLSEQELVSCDGTDSGCGGGLMDNAFKWLLANRGGWIDTEASYPYVSGGSSVPACNPKEGVKGAKITGYKDLPKDEKQMGEWMLTKGVISLAVDATSFQTYTSGILTNCISQQIDHGVLAVGFDDANVPPYWIIKNSWGTAWGEAGYIRVAKGTNQCLITTIPCTSII